MLASSSSGGSGGTSGGSRPPGSGSGSGGYSGGQPPRGGGSGGRAGGGGGQPPFSSSGRPTRPTAPAGQERTVSYQREEERYWTDYLRVALPVIGLLLMLGLFWYWAQSLIGDDDDNAPPTEITQLITDPTPVPTEPQQVDIVTTPGSNESDQTDGGQETEPTETPTEDTEADGQEPDGQDGADQTEPDTSDDPEQTDQNEPESVGLFEIGDLVVVTEEGSDLQLRDQPSLNGEVLASYPAGTLLTVIGDTVAADDYSWVEVEDEEGEAGYVADEFLALSE
ncbi:MAG: SH3 domain-containing protein [Thermomicrobiales bacterium]